MCGLIGALLAQPSLTQERIAGALATIAHRGPDHTGWWRSADRRMMLGHVRLRDDVLPEVYDRQKHPFLSPPALEIDDPLAVFCQDTLRSRSVEDQPFFDPCRVRGLMDQVAAMEPAARAAFQGVVLGIVSTCILQQRFGLAA